MSPFARADISMWIKHPCSTLGACLEGRKEFFTGLALETLEEEWTEYPVLRLDLNAETYNTMEGLRSHRRI
jgi:hypothetical protein